MSNTATPLIFNFPDSAADEPYICFPCQNKKHEHCVVSFYAPDRNTGDRRYWDCACPHGAPFDSSQTDQLKKAA